MTVQRRREVVIALLLLFTYGFFRQVPLWNENSRYDLVLAIAQQGTTRIDRYEANTGDKAFYQGHWFSDKAPGTALLGVPIYAALALTSMLTGGGEPGDSASVQALAFVESGLATTILVLLLIRFLGPLVGDRWATTVGLAYGLGSIAFPFATMFFGHALAAAALFASFYVLHRWRSDGGRWRPFLAGFLGGLAVLTEIPSAIGVAVLVLYALWISRRGALAYVLGGAPLAVVLAAYNWISFGSPASIGYTNLAAGGFAAGMSQGILGVTLPSLSALVDLLVGPRGLLRLAPWFVAAPLGILAVPRRELRAEVIVCAAIATLFLVANAGYYLPLGGATPGPRFLMPALPFAALLVGVAPVRSRVVVGPLFAVAAGVFLVATATMPNALESLQYPVGDLWLPRLLSGSLADTAAWVRWGLHGLMPLAVLLTGLTLGTLAIAISFGARDLAARATGRAAVLLAGLTLAFSFPFPPPAPMTLGWPGPGAAASVAIVDMGATSLTVGGVQQLEFWAQVENAGRALSGVRAQFRVATAAGTQVWSAWYGGVSVAAHSRETIRMTWTPAGVSTGEYRYGLLILDEGSGTLYASAMGASPFSLGR